MGELEAAVKTDKRLRFGLYYSLFEWFHPLYNNDEKNNFSTSDFVTAKMLPELTELVTKYKVGRTEEHGRGGGWRNFPKIPQNLFFFPSLALT